MDKWHSIRLGDFLTLKRGYDLPSQLRADSGTIPIVSSSGISGYHNEAKISPPGVVTGRYGSVGAVFYVEQPFWPLNTTLYVEDFKGNDPLFTYYLLQILDFKKYSDKTSVPGVNRNDLHRIKLLRPPLPEQRKIAEILSTWDEAIAASERLLSALRERKKGLMQRLLTGQVRFAGFAGVWREVSLADIAINIVDGPFGSNLKTSDYVSQGVPVLQGNNITNNVFVWKGVRFITEEKAEELKRSKAYIGDHLLIKIGSIGYSAILDDLHGHEYAIIPANLAKITPNDQIIDSDFLHFWLTSEETIRHFNTVASRTAQPALSLKTIKNTRIKLPGLDEQKTISAILNASSQQIRLYEKQLAALQAQKKGLMQRLLTGEVRVKI